MSADYLTSVAERLLGLTPTIRPRLAARYEPMAAVDPIAFRPADDAPLATSAPAAARRAPGSLAAPAERVAAAGPADVGPARPELGMSPPPPHGGHGIPTVPIRVPPAATPPERLDTSLVGLSDSRERSRVDREPQAFSEVAEPVPVIVGDPPVVARPPVPARSPTSAVASPIDDSSRPAVGDDGVRPRRSRLGPQDPAAPASVARVEVAPTIHHRSIENGRPAVSATLEVPPAETVLPRGAPPVAHDRGRDPATPRATVVARADIVPASVVPGMPVPKPPSARPSVTVAATPVAAWRDAPPEGRRAAFLERHPTADPDQRAERDPPIHVTIGRIEIRAVPGASPAQRPARRSAAMGLEEYLRRKTQRRTP